MPNTTYRNPWFDPNNPCSCSQFETDAIPTEYKGFLIYHRIDSHLPIESGAHVFDIVRFGVAVGQAAGFNGARAFIDRGLRWGPICADGAQS